MFKVLASTEDWDAMLPVLEQQSTPRVSAPNGHHASGWHRVLAVPRWIAAVNAQAVGGWLLRLQNLRQNLPRCSRQGPGPGPGPQLHELSNPGTQKSRGADLPQSCLQEKVGRGGASWDWQKATAILPGLPPITCLRQPIALALHCQG